nr:hypothetical protein [Burkholderia sp. Bp8963]
MRIALSNETVIGKHDRLSRHTEFRRKRSCSGQARAGAQLAAKHRIPQVIGYLFLKG